MMKTIFYIKGNNRMKFRTCLYVLCTAFISTAIYADAIQHCPATYAGKPFDQVTIYSNADADYGPTECGYKNANEPKITATYRLPKDKVYYPVSGNWRSTMPGFQWCNIADHNTYDSCTFSERYQA